MCRRVEARLEQVELMAEIWKPKLENLSPEVRLGNNEKEFGGKTKLKNGKFYITKIVLTQKSLPLSCSPATKLPSSLFSI